MRRQREETSATTAAAAAQTIFHPVITKLPLLNRVFRFACNIATTPFSLAAVTSTWNETLTDPEWGCADALFDSLADADNTNLSEQQVKTFWRTAVFMLKNGKNIELLASLGRAIAKENQKAAAEFAAGDKTAVAKHRMQQQQGALLATFRDVTGIPAHWGWSMDTPLSRWKRVALHDNGSVEDIFVGSCGLSGSIAWESLPATLNSLNLAGNQFSGSVCLDKLPSSMETLDLYGNQFSGSVSLEKLPSAMQYLHLYGNQFSGSVSLDKLPSTMTHLFLANNQFSGSVSLDKLPSSMESVYLDGNQFSGSVSLEQLPSSMQHLDISGNNWSVKPTKPADFNGDFRV